jgi:two-component system NtrC family response regulator
MAIVYIVDDEPHILTVVQALLESQGHEVFAEPDGNKVLDRIRQGNRVDLLISDVRMAPLNGMDLLQQVKEIDPSLPVLLITAYFSREIQQTADRLGAAACIRKPFGMKTLIDAVNKALA